jgi:hypothetical protein
LHFDVALAIQDSGSTPPSREIDKDGGPIQVPEMRSKATERDTIVILQTSHDRWKQKIDQQ